MTQRKNKPGQGRKPIGTERGGLKRFSVSLYYDQIEALRTVENPQSFVRDAVDSALKTA